MTIPINPQAVRLIRSALRNEERILILGASGWFGRTALALLEDERYQILGIASADKEIFVNGVRHRLREWDFDMVKAFRPTVLLDFAFLTKDAISKLGLGAYVKLNNLLSRRSFSVLKMSSVTRVLSVSSGAAVEDLEAGSVDPYGNKKREIEQELQEFALRRAIQVTVARAWSVSGGFVTKPRNYAFSDFVLGGLTSGTIQVFSNGPVYRRYCSVEDLLALSLGHSSPDSYYELDSGGDLVELGELAETTCAHISGSRIEFAHNKRDRESESRYHSTGSQWQATADRLGYQYLDLKQQVKNVVLALQQGV